MVSAKRAYHAATSKDTAGFALTVALTIEGLTDRNRIDSSPIAASLARKATIIPLTSPSHRIKGCFGSAIEQMVLNSFMSSGAHLNWQRCHSGDPQCFPRGVCGHHSASAVAAEAIRPCFQE